MTFGLSGAALAGIAIGGATLVSGVMGANAAEDAANLQAGAAKDAADGTQARFEAVQKLLQPFVDSGTQALGGQKDLVGLNGGDAQQKAIAALQGSPMFTALQKQGETSILANASATGGLRGGNVQGALAQFSPALLAQVINDQYSRLGGIATSGQNAAAGVGTANLQTGSQINALLQQQAAAQAGGAIAQGQAWQSIPNAIAGGLGIFRGLGGKF